MLNESNHSLYLNEWGRSVIDPHNHLLPGIDDGARSPEISYSMLARLQSLGFHTIVTTPHVTDAPTAEYASRVASAFQAISAEAAGIGIHLISGYEVMLTPRTARLLSDGAPLTLGNSHTVLVEVSLAGWPAFADSILFDLQIAGFTPILAHPERYQSIIADPSKAIALADRGVVLQITTSAFTGLFGRDVQRTAEALLLADAVGVLGSDAHGDGKRMDMLADGIARVEELVGPTRTQQLLVDNMDALLNDRALPIPAAMESTPRRKRGLLSRIR
ncbi:N/A [soil metagenome]